VGVVEVAAVLVLPAFVAFGSPLVNRVTRPAALYPLR